MSDWTRLNLDDCPEEQGINEVIEADDCDQEDDADFWEHDEP